MPIDKLNHKENSVNFQKQAKNPSAASAQSSSEAQTSSTEPQKERDAWQPLPSRGALQRFAESAFQKIAKSVAPASLAKRKNPASAGKAAVPSPVQVDAVVALPTNIENAFNKQLVLATEKQMKGDFSGALELIKDVVETSKERNIDIGKIMTSYPVSIVTSSMLCNDHRTLDYLIRNKLAFGDFKTPHAYIAAVHAKNLPNSRLGYERILDKAMVNREHEGRAAFELTGTQVSFARALVETNDPRFVVDVVENAYTAAALAIAVGSPAFAMKLLQTIINVDPDLNVELDNHLKPPPYQA